MYMYSIFIHLLYLIFYYILFFFFFLKKKKNFRIIYIKIMNKEIIYIATFTLIIYSIIRDFFIYIIYKLIKIKYNNLPFSIF